MRKYEWLIAIGTSATFVGLLYGCTGAPTVEPHSTTHAAFALDAGLSESAGPARFSPDFEQNPIEFEPNTTAPSYPTSLAFDGNNYLVAWQFWGNTEWHQLARITPQQNVLDKTPIEIDDNDDTEIIDSQVASDGTGFVVVYRVCDRLTTALCNYRIKRISAEGLVIDPVGIPLTSVEHPTNNLRLSSNGNGYLAVWSEQDTLSSTEQHLHTAVLDDAATLPIVKTTDVTETLPSTVSSSVRLALSTNSTNYLVAWTTRTAADDRDFGFDISVTRITPSGVVLPSNTDAGSSRLVLGATTNSQFALGSDGRDFLITWTDFEKNTSGLTLEAVYGARITSEGVFTADSPVALTTSEFHHRNSSIAFDGDAYIATWLEASVGSAYDGYHWHGSVIASDGTIREPRDRNLVTGAVTSPIVAPTCNGPCFLAWSSSAFSREDNVYTASYDGTRAPVTQDAATVVSLQQKNESSIRTTCKKDGCVSLWSQSTLGPGGGSIQLTSGRLDSDGQLLPNCTWPVALPNDYYKATLATNGNDYLVAWWDKSTDGPSPITVQHLDSTGKPLKNDRFTVANSSDWPSDVFLTSNGNGYLLVYHEARSNGTIIKGITLNADGSVKEAASFTLDLGSNYLYPTQLVATSTTYLLGFRSNNGGTVARFDAQGHLISGSIQRIDPTNAPTSGTVSFYDIATDGRTFLIAWCNVANSDATTGSCEPNGTLMTPDGTLNGLKQPLGPTTNNGALVWDGNAYVWAWAAPSISSFEPITQHFTELTLDGSGNVLSVDSNISNLQQTSAVTMSANGLLWTYTVPSGHPDVRFYGPSRLHRRILTGLCFGDPKGDTDGNGICDSKESEGSSTGGTGGMGGTSGTVITTSSSGGTSSYVSTGVGTNTGGGTDTSVTIGGTNGTSTLIAVGGLAGTNVGTRGTVTTLIGTGGVSSSTRTHLATTGLSGETHKASSLGHLDGTGSTGASPDASRAEDPRNLNGGCACHLSSSKSASSGFNVAVTFAMFLGYVRRKNRRTSALRSSKR